jgi:hypothetical protein
MLFFHEVAVCGGWINKISFLEINGDTERRGTEGHHS